VLCLLLFYCCETNPSRVTRLSCFRVAVEQDAESDVRAGAAKSVSGYYELVGNDRFIAEIVPAIKEFASEASLPVRSALAGSVMDVAPKMSAASATLHVLPLAMQFLRDDSAEACSRTCCACALVASTLPSLRARLAGPPKSS
jgi:hypothetical protein